MSEGTQRRLAAIVSADVVGYSRLMGRDEAGTLRRLNMHRSEHIDPLIAKHGGRIVKTTGDGLLLEFPSVVAAVECCIAVQNGMAERNIGVGEDAIQLRVGTHLGDVIVEGDDIFGDGVNIAARLQEISEAGGVTISSNAHDSVEGRIAAEFIDGGAQELKNIARPVRVWRWSPQQQASTQTVVAGPGAPRPLPDKPAIAVLPFDNMSDDPEQEFFADGMAEDIITALSKFHSFFVIARNSSFTFKARASDVTQVANELGAKYIVEGSVRRSGNRLRITAQLIEGGNGNHIWAERFDRSLDDIFDIQDEITEKIVGTIAPEISIAEQKRAARRHPENLDAWGLLQRGLNFMWRWDRNGFENAIEMFRRAVISDPSLSQAQSYLAFALLHMRYLGYAEDDADIVTEAARHAREALSLDEADSLAHAILARIFSHELRYDDSINEAQRAVQLNPNHAFAHLSLAVMHIWANRCSEGLEAIDQAIRLSPNDPFMPLMLAAKGVILGETGRVAEAIDTLKASCRLPNADYRSWLFLATYAVAADETSLARDAAAKVLDLMPEFSATVFRRVWIQMDPALHESLARKYIKAGLPE